MNYYKNLLYILPISIGTSIFLTNLIISLCSILFLVDTFRYKLWDYYKNNFFKTFIIFFILINISTLKSGNILSLEHSLSYLRFGIFSIFIFYVVKNYKNFLENFYHIFIITVILILIDASIQLVFGKNIFLMELNKYNTGLNYVTGIFDNEKKLGSYLARLTPLILIASLIIFKKTQNILNVIPEILILFLCFIIIMTTERVAFFIYMITFILIFMKSKIFFSNKIKWLFIFSIFITLIFYLRDDIFLKYFSTFYQSGLLDPGYASHDLRIKKGNYEADKILFFSKFYTDQFLISLKIFKENVLFGIGPKNFSSIENAGWHPHNYHAQVLAELGIFSYLIIISLLIFFSIKIIKIFFFNKFKTKFDEIKFLFFIFFILTLLPIPSGDFFNSWLNSINFLIIGFYLPYET